MKTRTQIVTEVTSDLINKINFLIYEGVRTGKLPQGASKQDLIRQLIDNTYKSVKASLEKPNSADVPA